MSTSDFYKAECPYCGQHIEVPSGFISEWITCPNLDCSKSFPPAKPPYHKTTDELLEEMKRKVSSAHTTPPPSKVDPNPPPPSPKKSVKHSDNSSLLIFCGVIGFLIGCGLVVAGIMDDAAESRRLESSAIRQTVYTIQYCAGFIIIALCLILSALISIIRKL